MRGAFWVARPPIRITSISSSTGAPLHRDPVRRRARLEAAPPQPSGGASVPSAPIDAVDGHRPIGRIGGAERLEGALGVQVGRVLGEDREHELAHRVEARVAPRPAVESGELRQDEGRRGRARRALQGACPGAGARSGFRRGRFFAVADAPPDAARHGRPQPDQPGEALPAALERGRAGSHRLLDGLRALDHRHRDRARPPPGPRSPPAPRRRRPRRTGRRPRRARRATPRAVFPNAVWLSIRPSPVRTRSAPASLAAKPVASITSSTPGHDRERPEAVAQAGQPEDRPAGRAGPGRVALAPSDARLQGVRPAAERGVEVADVDRAGALLGAVDGGRAGGAEQRVGDVARRSAGRPRRGAGSRSSRWISRVGSTVIPSPSAARIPRPPSVVALPPTPRSIRRIPASSAARSTSPVPYVDAPAGSRSAGARSESPDAEASSTTARVPSVETSQRASIVAAERIVGRHAPPFPAAGRLDGDRRPLAAVGERRQADLVGGSGPQPARGDGARDLDRGERALEGVGRDEDDEGPFAVGARSAGLGGSGTARVPEVAAPPAPPGPGRGTGPLTPPRRRRGAPGTPGSGSSAGARDRRAR